MHAKTLTWLWLGSITWMVCGCGDDNDTTASSATTTTSSAGGSGTGGNGVGGSGGAEDSVPPTAYVVFPVAVGPSLPSGTAFPVVAAGADDVEVQSIEVLIDGESKVSGDGVPTLWRSDTGSGTDAGAISQESLTGDGYFEFTMPAVRTQKVIGVGGPDMGANLADIEHGLYFTPSGNLSGALGTGSYSSGDVFRIEVAGTTLRALKNGNEIRSVTVASGRTWFLDTWLTGHGSALSDAKIAVSGEAPVPITWANQTGVTEALAVSHLWDSTTVSDGPHTFASRVTDMGGNVTESEPVERVVDNTLPLCTLGQPMANATVSGTIVVSGTATDANLFTLAFFADDTLISQHDNQAQAMTSWDTTTVANGTHTVRAMAYDHAFLVSTPCEVTVNVNN